MLRRSFGTYSTSMMPNTILVLMIVNGIVYLLQQVFGYYLTYYLGLVPGLFWHGYLWQVVSYMFLHGSFFHIGFNMLMLWVFGRTLVSIWGSKKFLRYYFFTGIGAGLLNAILTPASAIPIIGASGAIYGLLLAFGLMFPNQPIFVFPIPFPIQAKYLVIGAAAIEFFSSFNLASPVAHFAHLGGMLFGLIYLKWPVWVRKFGRWRGDQQRKQHLKVVYRREDETKKLQKEVDDLLDKINREGLDALSAADKKRLEEASKKLREWDKGAGFR